MKKGHVLSNMIPHNEYFCPTNVTFLSLSVYNDIVGWSITIAGAPPKQSGFFTATHLCLIIFIKMFVKMTESIVRILSNPTMDLFSSAAAVCGVWTFKCIVLILMRCV